MEHMKNKTNIYIYLLTGSLLFLLAFVFLGPTKEADKKKAYLWKEDWEKIEYIHKQSEKKEASTGGPEKRILFYRKPGLTKDQYFVEAPEARAHTNPGLRLGNAQVKNLFRNWRSPEDKGTYKADPQLKEKFGLETPSSEIRFFRDAKQKEPNIVLQTGTKQKQGNYFLEVKEQDADPVLAHVSGYLVENLRYDLDRYRERRFLFFPAGSYLKEFEISIQKDQEPKQELRLLQVQKKEDGKVVTKYYRYDKNHKTELPAALFQPFLAVVKRIEIRRFSDETELSKLRRSKPPAAPPLKIALKITNSQGDVFEAELYSMDTQGKQKTNSTASQIPPLAYFRQARAPQELDFVDAAIPKDILSHASSMASYQPPPPKP